LQLKLTSHANVTRRHCFNYRSFRLSLSIGRAAGST